MTITQILPCGTEGFMVIEAGCGHVLVSNSRARIGDEEHPRKDAPFVIGTCDVCRAAYREANRDEDDER